MTNLEFACKHFGKEKLIRVSPNGFDINTGEPSIPGGYINASSFSEGIKLLMDWPGKMGPNPNMLLDKEIEVMKKLMEA